MSALLALSDVLVVRALERCYSRGLPGDARRRAAALQAPRHRAYEQIRIPLARHSHALEDAFAITPEIARRWALPVDAEAWALVLDNYCRDRLVTMKPHDLDELEVAIRLLGAGPAT